MSIYSIAQIRSVVLKLVDVSSSLFVFLYVAENRLQHCYVVVGFKHNQCSIAKHNIATLKCTSIFLHPCCGCHGICWKEYWWTNNRNILHSTDACPFQNHTAISGLTIFTTVEKGLQRVHFSFSSRWKVFYWLGMFFSGGDLGNWSIRIWGSAVITMLELL